MNPNTLFNIGVALRATSLKIRNAEWRGRNMRWQERNDNPIDIFMCIVDHYEPQVGRPAREKSRERVEDWLNRYPQIANCHRDAEGMPPKHSFFYPWDEYDSWELDRVAELCRAGFGEIELHLHHQDDTDATLRHKLRDAKTAFQRHGGLTRWPDGKVAWGFIHGNWALDNSRQDSGRNYCGVNNELTVLQEEGCYADFTFPAWKQLAQPRKLNSIYYAIDDPKRPKSYNTGRNACVACTNREGLLMIQGPLVPYVTRRSGKWRVAMDDCDIAFSQRYTPERLDRWVEAGVHIQERPNWVFIKLHCHGAEDRNRNILLGYDLEALFQDIEHRYNDGERYRLHYVTAREVFNLVKAAECGVSDIKQARDWILKPPSYT